MSKVRHGLNGYLTYPLSPWVFQISPLHDLLINKYIYQKILRIQTCSIQIFNVLALNSYFHFVSTSILWPVNGIWNGRDQPFCCVVNAEKAKLTTCLLWNVAKKLFTNKIKTIVEIILKYFIFQYVLSFCLYLYPMVCCWHLKLAKISGPASWLKVQRCFYEGFWRPTDWKKSCLQVQY